MSLFGKLFGQRSLAEVKAQADTLFEQGQFGAAKLAYERARKLAGADCQTERIAIDNRVAECCDSIARARIADAESFIERGDDDLAIEELHGAAQTAVSRSLVTEANDRIERLERKAVREQLQSPELAPEDRFEVLAGGFEEDQHAEYAAHGPMAVQALLMLHGGDIKGARALLEELVPKADAPRYLHFELGRARLADGDSDAGAEALQLFLSKLGPEEGGLARLSAHAELATVIHARGDIDGAIAQYEAALDAMPEDPRPYLALARFLRRQSSPDEAVEVLMAALDALDGERLQWRVWEELGLAHADAQRDEQAIEWLERVIEYLVAQQRTEPSPEAAVRLAQLHEKRGNPGRALDLFALLTRSSDSENLAGYHLEAARLLRTLGLHDEERRMLQRAGELLADEQPEVRERIDSRLAELAS